jgi:enediyne biosynthesis protein E4
MTRRRAALAVGLAGVLAAAAFAVVVVGVGGGRTPTEALAAPRFVDAAASSGLVHTYDGDSRFWTGGGLAAFDCDDDGDPELYLAGGSDEAALFRNASRPGSLAFARVRDPATDLTDVTGAYPLDIDGDGRLDLAVLRVGENVLLRGLGDCRFERANERLGFDGGDGRTMAFSATWEGDAALPTLAIGDYIPLDELGTPEPPCPDGTFVRPEPDAARYGAPVALAPTYCPLSMLFSDWDRSGRRDLRVSNDRQYYREGQEQLWRVVAGEPPVEYTADDGWVTMQIFGMGIASQDLTGDGYPEVYLTSQGDNRLQTLTAGAAQPTYRDIALRRGVNAAQPYAGGEALPSTAWHPAFADVNADGFLDLFVTKGNVMEQAGYATKDPSELLIGQPDGTFRRAAEDAGIVRFERGRGAAVVDLDLDGLLDIVQIDVRAPVEVWHNVGGGTAETPAPMGAWAAIRLRDDGPNREAIGAWIEVKVGERVVQHELTVGGGHVSGQLGWLHLGLGPSSSAEVLVTWPDGTTGPWQRVDAGTFSILARGAAPERWEPGS